MLQCSDFNCFLITFSLKSRSKQDIITNLQKVRNKFQISNTGKTVDNHLFQYIKHTVALNIQETCGTKATVPRITTFVVDVEGISPSIADTKDVFPSPVVPTTATRLPTGISKLMLERVGLSICRMIKVKVMSNYIIKQTNNQFEQSHSNGGRSKQLCRNGQKILSY